MTEWYISRYTTYSPKFGYVNILGSDKKWRVAFSALPEVQGAFDGSTNHHRFFDTAEDAQKAFDAFTYNGVIWDGTEDDFGHEEITGTISPGVEVTLECTDSWRSWGEDHEEWELTGCSHADFEQFVKDAEDILVDNFKHSTSWDSTKQAKAGILAVWDKYQLFLQHHGGKTYAEVAEAEAEAAA
jgi:hypothetical protein